MTLDLHGTQTGGSGENPGDVAQLPAQATDPRPAHRDLSYLRERVVRALMASMCVLGLVAYVPSVWLAAAQGLWSIVVVDTLAYGWVVGLTVWPGASYYARAASICLISYVLGVVLMATVGLPGSGILWIGAAPVMLAVLVGFRAASLALIVNVATFGVLAFAIHAGWIDYAPVRMFPDRGLAVFLVSAANSVLLSAVISLSVAALLRSLEETHRDLEREIDERERAIAGRGHLEAQLRESHKLEAVGRLASGVAHDFNNLLVPILAHADDLRRGLPSGDERLGALNDIVLSAERGRDLVQRVLAFSRRAVSTRMPVRVEAAVRESAQLLRAGLPHAVEIVVDSTAPEATVLADPVELHQIVMNLGTNAAHAMRLSGGRLAMRVSTDVESGIVTLVVSDTGKGMSPEVLAHAFEPFFTTKQLGEGSGLGLATVHAIVRDLGGQVAIDSTPGAGTTVSVMLPAHAGAAGPPQTDPPSAGPSPAPLTTPVGRRVLIVDDEALVLKTCAMAFTRLGYDVTAINDSREAARYLERAADSLDLLVTDRAMPGVDGLALACLARDASATLPILVATGFLDEATYTAVQALGRAAVITKPYRAADLAAAVEAVTTVS